ncbi:MAG: hypothetical protein KGH62_01640 [Candidatus Micrarchaeota archaeon]|nr:hypothetical protein [Candidatus Micrarchaeota archaeon]
MLKLKVNNNSINLAKEVMRNAATVPYLSSIGGKTTLYVHEGRVFHYTSINQLPDGRRLRVYFVNHDNDLNHGRLEIHITYSSQNPVGVHTSEWHMNGNPDYFRVYNGTHRWVHISPNSPHNCGSGSLLYVDKTGEGRERRANTLGIIQHESAQIEGWYKSLCEQTSEFLKEKRNNIDMVNRTLLRITGC